MSKVNWQNRKDLSPILTSHPFMISAKYPESQETLVRVFLRNVGQASGLGFQALVRKYRKRGCGGGRGDAAKGGSAGTTGDGDADASGTGGGGSGVRWRGRLMTENEVVKKLEGKILVIAIVSAAEHFRVLDHRREDDNLGIAVISHYFKLS
ncbi:hypothetical protein M0802_008111 [Mischocyttarus mexicanus]|nr:hypothetical protein M0802_008111 [Mischocyttarus mexicanus]